MSAFELTTKALADMAGWQVMKQAREIVASGRVLDSEWNPPVLRGTVQIGSSAIRSGMVLKSSSDVENICPCRDSRERALICAHAVAVGLRVLEPKAAAIEKPTESTLQSPPSKSAASSHIPARSAKPAKAVLRAKPGETGEPLEIHVILPPNLSDALARGQVMLYMEGKWSRGRAPLNVVPQDRAFVLQEVDRALLDVVEPLNDGDTPGMLRLTCGQFGKVLASVPGHPRFTIGKAQLISITSEPVKLKLTAELQPSGEILLRCAAMKGQVFGAETLWILDGATFARIALPLRIASVLQSPLLIPRKDVPLFVSQSLPEVALACDVTANFQAGDFEISEGKPRFRLYLAGGIAMLQAKLECDYGTASAQNGADAFWIPDPANSKRYTSRNPVLEQEGLARLTGCGFTGPDARGMYQLNGQERILNFFAREYPKLQREWEVTMEERLQKSTAANIERVDPQFQVTSSGEQWFELAVTYSTNSGQQLSAADVQRLLRSGQSFMRLPNGKFGVMDTGGVEELNEVLVDCAPEQRAGYYRMRNIQAAFLQSTLERQQGWKLHVDAGWAQKTAKLTGKVQPTLPKFGDLQDVLRPYQKEGVGWLRFLRENGFGGILADDMGLGKTLQLLAHLSVLRAARSTDAQAPFLVVCPSSLVFNWMAEAAKFTPKLRAIAIEGSSRNKLFPEAFKHDLVITSYALLRRDAEFYRGCVFDTVVLDEAQHIKNRETQNAQAVKSIRAAHRLVLTGTPMENSVLDLWSIFDFLMPGYLGTANDFKERYEVPITREKDGTVQGRLARRIRPFMLRRMKRDVAKDLPEKIEQVSLCDMTEAQAGLYQGILQAARTEIISATAPAELARSRMLVLTALLRLRQICCDPRLLRLEDGKPNETVAAPRKAESGKLELFSELLEEILDGGHRALVFSQFTSMLALLREDLDRQNIAYCYLDGATRDRAEVVRKFQSNDNIPVFLISLKAGGVGLNLTGADTVIHFDPWWNPAVEAQATDRAHRIGQKKVVTSYKLITRGTVEEKILKLQQRKQATFNAMMGDEEQFSQSLSWEEIRELISA